MYRVDKLRLSPKTFPNFLKISVVEPEPDFLAGAGAVEKAPAPGCCCLA